MTQPRPKFWKRQLLVDRSIQLPLMLHSLAMATLGFLLSTAFAVVVATIINFGYPMWIGHLALFLSGTIAVFIMMSAGMILSNKIAGPLFRLKQHMKAVADGESPPTPISGREKDFTDELFSEYNRLLEKLKKPAE